MMIAEVLLLSSLAALPLSPLPASDRHAEMVDHQALIADMDAPSDTFEVAQYMPPAGGPPMGPRAAGPAGPEGRGMHGPMRLRMLGLSEAQEDAVFNLFYAQMPQMREQMKALRKAREALHDAARSDAFDEQKASTLAADIGRITATLQVMRARTEAAVWKLLTPEQRARAAQFGPMMRGPWGVEGAAPKAPR
jgi:periplasmic protein CpxP/Spy